MWQNIEGIFKPPITIYMIRLTSTVERRHKLLAMLSPLEPLKRHEDVKSVRTKNTGTWLLEREAFCKWRDSDTIEDNTRVFCCYGIPGAGKTVIWYEPNILMRRITNVYFHSSVAIENLYSQLPKYPDIGIACLYADHKDQTNQTLTHILGSFLHQFLTTAPREPIPNEVVQTLENIWYRGGKVGTEDTLTLLRKRLDQLNRAFICIDAVDELEPKVRQQLLNTLKDLCTKNTRLFLTGRGHVENEVQKCFQATQRMTLSASHQDIQLFVRQEIKDNNSEAIDDVLAKEIEDAIISKSKGMYVKEFERDSD